MIDKDKEKHRDPSHIVSHPFVPREDNPYLCGWWKGPGLCCSLAEAAHATTTRYE